MYQGRVAVYLALEKIISLDAEDIEQYALEMENCEDIAIIRTIDSVEQYISIHQVKHENSETLNGYKKPLVQLMLEKGYCESHRYGKPEAYLHTSKGVKVDRRGNWINNSIVGKMSLNNVMVRWRRYMSRKNK